LAIDGPGNDVFRGGEGDDAPGLDSGGADVFVGGPGVDAIGADRNSQGTTVIDLSRGRVSGSATGRVTVSGIENASGTLQDDTLIGDGADNVLEGFRGDDHIEGRAGDDLLDGLGDVDFLDGGEGTDRCLFGETVLNCEVVVPRRTGR
jgi:Ca2+-binding RTX toxin-like protein